MTENYTNVPISLPPDLVVFLEDTAQERRVSKAQIAQEALYHMKKRKNNDYRDRLAFSFLLIVIGTTLLFFTMLVYPIFDTSFILFIACFASIGIAALISGYAGMYVAFKKKRYSKTWT